MSKEQKESWKPFLSVLMIIFTLFSVVFFHMEIRRVGYTVLTLAKELRELRDNHRGQTVHLARITGPQRLNQVAQMRFTLKRAEPGQIIQMTEQGLTAVQ